MAKNRYIDTRFWHDTFIRSKLNPLDRYLFLYFLTNDKTNIIGLYELPIEMICFETGIEDTMIKTMLNRMSGKIYYIEGWVFIKNFLKYQNIRSPKIKIGIKNSLDEVPAKIKDKVEKIIGVSIRYIYGIDTISHLNKNKNKNKNKNGNKNKKISPLPISQFVDKCKKSEKRYIQILGDYAETKNLKFETVEQWSGFVKRNTDDAVEIEPYTKTQISDAMKKLNKARKEYLTEWNLKTLIKFLDQ